MSNVDPIRSGAAFAAGNVEDNSLDYNDPAAVLMVLSAQQLTILQSTMAAQIGGLRDQADTLTRIQGTSQKLRAAHDSILSDERRAAEQVLHELGQVKDKYLGGEESNLLISPADNERFQALAEWCSARGYTMQEMIRIVEPPPAEVATTTNETETTDSSKAVAPSETGSSETASSETVVEGDSSEPAEPQLEIDRKAVEANIRALFQYVDSVRAGRVDNPAIRQQITEQVAAHNGGELLGQVGISTPIETLDDINDAIERMQAFSQSVKGQMQTHVDAMRTVHTRVRELSGNTTQALKEQEHTEQTRIEREDLVEILRRQVLDDELQSDIRESLEAAAALESIIVRQGLNASTLQEQIQNMPVAQRTEFDRSLGRWEADLSRDLQQANVTHNKTHAASHLRRSYL